jgi:hypothetical protein
MPNVFDQLPCCRPNGASQQALQQGAKAGNKKASKGF